MVTILVIHEVDDVDHWLASTQREEVFGPLGITARTFVEQVQTHRVGLIVESPDLDTFQNATRLGGRRRSNGRRRSAGRRNARSGGKALVTRLLLVRGSVSSRDGRFSPSV